MNMDRRYKAVRKKLDSWGYKQALSIESLALVEKLINDLGSDMRGDRSGADWKAPGSLRGVIEVLKGENAELRRDNNQLHQTLMKHLESSELASQELRHKIRKLQEEVNDYKFLNSQYIQKIKTMEQNNNEMAEQLLKMQERNAMAIIETRTHVLKKPGTAFRRQKMEIDGGTLPSADSFSKNQCRLCGSATYVQVEDPYVANMLEVADKRISQLQEELELAKTELENGHCTNLNLKQQVQSRDDEIDRLTKKIEYANLIIPETITHKVDVSKYIDKIESMEASKECLKQEFQVALQNQQKAEHEAAHVRSRYCELEQEVLRLRNAADVLNRARENQSQGPYDNMENNAMQCANERLQEIVNSRDKEICQLERDKRNLNDKINQLLSNERRLQHENDNLRQLNISALDYREDKDGTKNKLYSESDMKLLELQRDYYLHKVEELSAALDRCQNRGSDHEVIIRQHSCGRRHHPSLPASLPRPSRARTTPKRRALTPPPRWHATRLKTRRNAKSRSPSPADREVSCIACTSLPYISPKNNMYYSLTAEQCVKQLEQERDYYKQQYNNMRLKDGKKKTTSEREGDIDLHVRNHKHNLVVEELRSSVRSYKDDVDKLQKEIRELRDSKERIERLYRESEEDHRKHERDRTLAQSLAERSTVRRVERENEQISHDLHAVACERDALRERLKTATETQIAERSRLENMITSLEDKFDEKTKECNSLSSYLSSYKSLATQYEDQLRVLEQELAETNDKVVQHKAMANQMKKLVEQTQQRLQETEHELAAKRSAGLEECILKLESEIGVLNAKCMKQLSEIDGLRRTLSSLDREKDQLQTEVDIRTERLASLEDTLRQKERTISDLKITIHTLEANLDRQHNELVSRDKDVKSVRRQYDLADRDLQGMTASRDGIAQQLKTLQEDLMTMTRENQHLNAELDDARNGQKNMKEQIQDYVNEVSRVEALLKDKDRERLNLLEQFHNVTEEANSLESQNNQLECETATSRLELHAKNIEIQHLQNTVNTLQQEVEASIATQQTLELELSQTKRALTSLEEERQLGRQQVDSLREDLNTVKAVCAQLDATKEQMRSNLADKEAEYERLTLEMKEAESQMKGMHGDIQQQLSKIRELEHLLSTNRHTEFQSQLSMQDITAELRMAREQLSNSENRLMQSVEESTMMRSKAAELETELDRLRRQLTHERFEKERAVQEIRHLRSISPVLEQRSHSTIIRDESSATRPKSHHLEYRVHRTSDEYMGSAVPDSGRTSSRLHSGEEDQGLAKASSSFYSKWDHYKRDSPSGAPLRSWPLSSPSPTSALEVDVRDVTTRTRSESTRHLTSSPGGYAGQRGAESFMRREHRLSFHEENEQGHVDTDVRRSPMLQRSPASSPPRYSPPLHRPPS